VTGDGEEAWSPAWSSDGWLYYSSNAGGSFNVWRVEVDPGTGAVVGSAQSVAAPAGLVGHLTVSADGRRLAYASIDAQANVQRVALDPAGKVEGSPVWITTGSQGWSGVRCSPDAGRLALWSESGELFVSGADGSNLRRLTDPSSSATSAHWDATGGAIWFRSNRSGPNQIWRIEADGSGLRQITESEKSLANFIVSPDRRRILSHTHFDPNAIDLIEFDGEGRFLRTMALSEKLPLEPTGWSPDGRRLATANLEKGGIYVFAFDGGHLEQVAARGSAPAWIDDQTVVFRDDQGLSIVDLRTRTTSPLVATSPERAKVPEVCSGGRWLYYLRGPEEADIWMATLR
jgi:TolB protein